MDHVAAELYVLENEPGAFSTAPADSLSTLCVAQRVARPGWFTGRGPARLTSSLRNTLPHRQMAQGRDDVRRRSLCVCLIGAREDADGWPATKAAMTSKGSSIPKEGLHPWSPSVPTTCDSAGERDELAGRGLAW